MMRAAALLTLLLLAGCRHRVTFDPLPASHPDRYADSPCGHVANNFAREQRKHRADCQPVAAIPETTVAGE